MSSRLPLLALGLLAVAPLGAQAPLALGTALQRADAGGYGNRMAAAAAAGASARVAATDRGRLPGIHAEAGWVRSTDPLAAFGMIMRQRTVTPQAFDPAGLNFPAARSDLSTAVVLDAPLVNLDAWAGHAAARHAADAAQASAAWQAAGTRLDVVRAYFGAVLAGEMVTTLETANAAALAHVRQAESAVTNGLATRSDALLAAVKQGEVATRLAAARGQAAIARQRLALLLGTPDDTAFTLPASVPRLDTLATADGAAPERGDLKAADAGLAAAESAARAATVALLPRLNGFARYDWHDPRALLGGTAMWTVGVMATWSPFSGGAELAQRQQANADLQAARAGTDAARATAALEVRSAEIDLRVAVQALAIAEGGVGQAAEAHRIVGRKYEGGLAAVTELLDAQAAELGARLAEAKARYDLLVAHAALARARGDDLSTLAAALDAADGIRE